MNRTTSTTSVPPRDAGRTILEALVGLTLVALAVLSWSRMSVSATRAGADADHREIALELATSHLESLVVLPWDELAVDPGSPRFSPRFEGQNVVADPRGVQLDITVTEDGRDYDVRRVVLESGDDSWRRLVVEVTWDDGGRTASVRLDGAARRPSQGGSS